MEACAPSIMFIHCVSTPLTKQPKNTLTSSNEEQRTETIERDHSNPRFVHWSTDSSNLKKRSRIAKWFEIGVALPFCASFLFPTRRRLVITDWGRRPLDNTLHHPYEGYASKEEENERMGGGVLAKQSFSYHVFSHRPSSLAWDTIENYYVIYGCLCVQKRYL